MPYILLVSRYTVFRATVVTVYDFRLRLLIHNTVMTDFTLVTRYFETVVT